MKLLLTSSGLRNESQREALRGMLGRPASECRCVYIPTSYHAAKRDMTWFVEETGSIHALGWKEFTLLDVAVKGLWPKELWWPLIENADVIVMGGGQFGYLSYWLQKTGLFDALPGLLKTKVYVGISAGSMIVTARPTQSNIGQTDDPKDWNVKLNDPSLPEGQVSDKALGLFDFLFRPHWHKNDPKYANLTEEAVRKAYKYYQKPIYLVDDQTAIKIVDNGLEVVSEGKWVLVDSEQAA